MFFICIDLYDDSYGCGVVKTKIIQSCETFDDAFSVGKKLLMELHKHLLSLSELEANRYYAETVTLALKSKAKIDEGLSSGTLLISDRIDVGILECNHDCWRVSLRKSTTINELF